MSAHWAAWPVLAAPPLLALATAGFNVLAWSRGSAAGRIRGRVSVCIPARDEAARIERCVRATLAGTQAPHEVLVYDDGSADGTGAVVARVAAEDPRVRVIPGGPLPAGWIGKPHACHHLAREATGDVLVFVDADTAVSPECLARLGSLLEGMAADVVTVAPRHEVRTPGERLVVPLLHLTYLAWLPLPLVWRSRDPRFLVANGQLLAVRRRAYDAAGGWAAVRAEVVDDVAFCRRVKESGGRVVFADGHRMATVRMYEGWRAVWEGFSKNVYEGIGGRPGALAAVVVLYGGAFVLPYAALAAALAGTATAALLAPAAAGVGANLALRTLLAARFRQPAEGVLLHPLSVLALLAVAANSLRWSRRGAIRWRGRVYPARAARAAP